MSNPEDNFYLKYGKEPPKRTSHNIAVDDIVKSLTPLKPHSWRLEGNKLIAKTDMGELVNYIPPDYIMTGTDDSGLPILKRL